MKTRQHGKASTYTNGKCRCVLCREAHAIAQRGHRAGRPKKQPRDVGVITARQLELIELHLWCAVQGAGAYRRRCLRRFTYDELLSAAHFGLVQAAQHFDETRGAAFSSVAFLWIHKQLKLLIKDNMRSNGWVYFNGGRGLRQAAQFDSVDAALVISPEMERRGWRHNRKGARMGVYAQIESATEPPR